MWLVLACGFFSVTEDPKDRRRLQVRARVAHDLDRLRQVIPELGRTVRRKGTDYPVRSFVERQAFADGLARIAKEIDYPNFKHRVLEVDGREREGIYLDLWRKLLELERLDRPLPQATKGRS